MARNIVLSDSVLTSFGDLHQPSWLEQVEHFEVRQVGGLHNLSTRDKERWAIREGALRIIERGTGREEIWFGHKNGYPQYISLDQSGRLQSHSKFRGIWVPAMRFPQENLLGTQYDSFQHLDIWCDEGEINNPPNTHQWALEANNLKIQPLDPKAEYISHFHFTKIREEWEGGEWKRSAWKGIRIVFFKKELNDPELQQKMLDWIDQHCSSGVFPVGNPMFGDFEEEFLFVTEFCT